MHQLHSNEIRSILCLGAHADDLEIGCGGTLLSILARRPGIDVHWVVFSTTDRRALEAAASAKRFLTLAGRRKVVLRDYRDTFFPEAYGSIKDYFEEIKRDAAPDLIFTHRREDMHQDHRVIAELTWCAFRDHIILEYEIPKYEGGHRRGPGRSERLHGKQWFFGGHLLDDVAAAWRGVQLSYPIRRGLSLAQAARGLGLSLTKGRQFIARGRIRLGSCPSSVRHGYIRGQSGIHVLLTCRRARLL